MAENIGRRKGDYATHTFEPEFSRIYEIHEGFDILKIEEAIHNKLERLGVKVGPEWFEIEVERIDQTAIEVFSDHGPFKGALKELHLTDPTDIERGDYGSSSSSSSSSASASQSNTTTQTPKEAYEPTLVNFAPRTDQIELLAKLKDHFIDHHNPRGQIRLPPGYGKTQIGCCLFPIEHRMQRILILVPSIKLAKETAQRVREFHTNNLKLTCFKYYEVHSEGTPFTITEMNSNAYVCVVGVYNSVVKLQGATTFDIIVFDEAHRTSIKSRIAPQAEPDTQDTEEHTDDDADTIDTHFTFALSDANIQAKYRLFMTATPRIINNDDNSMSNVQKYGEVIYSMTIRQAVKQHIINDYKIWMYVKAHNEQLSIETDGERFALLMKFLEQCNGNKTLIVCRSIKACDYVASRLKVQDTLNVYSVHSKKYKHDVDQEIQKFKDTKNKSCLCAVNMFKEGIDCPAIDSVVFYDERSSVIDVLQIVGRGLRYKPNVDFTDIGILCSVNPSERLDDQSEMRYLRMIIQNMFDYNEELTNHLHVIKNVQDTLCLTGVDTMVSQVAAEMKDNEDTLEFNDTIKMNNNVFNYGELHFRQSRAYAQERSVLFGWRSKDDWFEYIEQAELPRDIPRRPDRVYKDMGWQSWDDFLGLDPEKPFDLSTYKYILQTNLKGNNKNPTNEEYEALVAKYGGNKVINPSECTKVYRRNFYDIIESIHGKNNFMSLQELRRLKSTYTTRGLFSIQQYQQMQLDHPNQLPHFPLVYYQVTSFAKL